MRFILLRNGFFSVRSKIKRIKNETWNQTPSLIFLTVKWLLRHFLESLEH